MSTPDPRRSRLARFAAPGLVAVCFLTWSAAVLWPALLGGPWVLPGAGGQDSDVIRGAWSLSQAAWGLPDPIFTHRAFFPVGVKLVPLPFASGLLLAPLQLLLGPLQAYDASLALLLAATAWCAAWLGRECTGSWGLGALAGGALAAQPMLLHAVADGTPEHLALWSLPATLAAAWRCHRTGDLRWALAVGLLSLALLLDSPYMAVFGLAAAPFSLAALLLQRQDPPLPGWRRLRPLLACALCTLPALALVGWLYRDLPLAPQDFTRATAATELAGNSAALRNWLNLEHGRGRDVLGNLVPALVPAAMLVPALALAAVGLHRSLPWALAGLLMVGLALGTNPDNALMLGWWAGETLGAGAAGAAVGQGLIEANAWLTGHFPFSGIRFPRRWLVPAALFLGLAGAVGLRGLLAQARHLPAVAGFARRRRLPLEIAGALGGPLLAALLLEHEAYLEPWATTRFPRVAFAEWLHAQPGPGAVMAFPTVRPGRPNTHRWELPVYANISDVLRSGDTLWFQLVHGRPDYVWPALFTARANGSLPQVADRLVRDANDMARFAITGDVPPPSSWDPGAAGERAEGRAWLQARGLRFVVLDLSVYQGEWLERALGFFAPFERQERFDDGDGVLVLELAP